MINDFSWLVLSPRLSLCSRSREHAERRVHARRENECLNKDFNLSHTHEPHINHRFVKRTSSDGIFSFFFLLFVRNKSISADGFLPTLLTRNSMNSLISHRNSHRSANIPSHLRTFSDRSIRTISLLPWFPDDLVLVVKIDMGKRAFLCPVYQALPSFDGAHLFHSGDRFHCDTYASTIHSEAHVVPLVHVVRR